MGGFHDFTSASPHPTALTCARKPHQSYGTPGGAHVWRSARESNRLVMGAVALSSSMNGPCLADTRSGRATTTSLPSSSARCSTSPATPGSSTTSRAGLHQPYWPRSGRKCSSSGGVQGQRAAEHIYRPLPSLRVHTVCNLVCPPQPNPTHTAVSKCCLNLVDVCYGLPTVLRDFLLSLIHILIFRTAGDTCVVAHPAQCAGPSV